MNIDSVLGQDQKPVQILPLGRSLLWVTGGDAKGGSYAIWFLDNQGESVIACDLSIGLWTYCAWGLNLLSCEILSKFTSKTQFLICKIGTVTLSHRALGNWDNPCNTPDTVPICLCSETRIATLSITMIIIEHWVSGTRPTWVQLLALLFIACVILG